MKHQSLTNVKGEITQIRMDTNRIVGGVAEKMVLTGSSCVGCGGTGLAPLVMGIQDACSLCLGTGNQIDTVKQFGRKESQ